MSGEEILSTISVKSGGGSKKKRMIKLRKRLDNRLDSDYWAI